MDLSYEARWLDLRRQLDDDAATLEDRATNAASDTQRNYLLQKRYGVLIALQHMDDLDRAGAHRA